jgi:hypothetical protein
VSTIKCRQVMLIIANICVCWESYEIYKYTYSLENLQSLLMLQQMGQIFTSEFKQFCHKTLSTLSLSVQF